MSNSRVLMKAQLGFYQWGLGGDGGVLFWVIEYLGDMNTMNDLLK